MAQAAKQKLTKRYGDAAAFGRAFAPEKTEAFAAHPERCVAGEAPALVDVALAYGDTVARGWLMAQIKALAAYYGDRNALTADQCYQCASTIQTHYFYLKTTDFMLYFSLLKAGRYGFFYGHIDPTRIVGWLKNYTDDRNRLFERVEAQRIADKRREEDRHPRYGPAMSREEYEQWKRDNPESYAQLMKELKANEEARNRRPSGQP